MALDGDRSRRAIFSPALRLALDFIAGHSARVQPNASTTSPPRALLAEDDEPSRHFLAEALRGLGWAVSPCADGISALVAAQHQYFDLLLLDRKLPGLGAIELLRTLRQDPRAASHASPAVVSSAEWTARHHAEALAAGFSAILDKPISVANLEAQLRHTCAPPAMNLRDDGAAERAAGNPANLARLRPLFVAELDRLLAYMRAGDTPDAELRERLHRLCAAAGFCGATALAAASRELLDQLRRGQAGNTERTAFIGVLAATLALFADTTLPAD